MKKIPINLILYTAMFLIAGILVISASRQSNQAVMSIPIPFHFKGEYSQNGGQWQTLDIKQTCQGCEAGVTLFKRTENGGISWQGLWRLGYRILVS